MSARSTRTARRHASEPRVWRSESVVARRCTSAFAAARSVAGPPCSTVSAALSTTTRSVSTRLGATRIAGSSVSSIGTSAGSDASWTTTVPWNRRAKSGVTSAVTSRWLARRARPHATRSVWLRVGIPSASSACDTAAITRGRGSPAGLCSGSAGDWTTIVAREAPRASDSRAAPASGKRSASSVAASASVPRPGGGGRSTTASSAAPATTSREPERSGTRCMPGILRASTDCSRPTEHARYADGG